MYLNGRVNHRKHFNISETKWSDSRAGQFGDFPVGRTLSSSGL